MGSTLPPTLTTLFPIPVTINVDGVDLHCNAEVVIDGSFPEGLSLGSQEFATYKLAAQSAMGEARIDEKASLVIAFGEAMHPVLLYGLIDTGSAVSLLSYSAYQQLSKRAACKSSHLI